MSMGNAIGEAFVEIRARGSQLQSDFNNIKNDIVNKAKEMADSFNKAFEKAPSIDQLKDKLKEAEANVKSLQKEFDAFNQLGKNPDVQKNLDRVTQSLTQAKQKVTELKDQMKDLHSNTRNFGDYVGNMLERIAVRMSIVFILFKTFQELKSSVETAEKSEGVTNAFNQQFNPSMLEKLRQSVKGVISDVQLMTLAIKSSKFNIPTDVLFNGLELVRRTARDTGEDVNKLAENFVESFGKKSVHSLEDLGISALDFQQKFKQTGSYVETISQLITEKLKNTSEGALTTGEKFKQLEGRIESLKIKIGESLLPTLLNLTDAFVNAGEKGEQFGGTTGLLASVVKGAALGVFALVDSVVVLVSVMASGALIGERFLKLLYSLTTFKGNNITQAWRELKDAPSNVGELMKSVSDQSMAIYKGILNNNPPTGQTNFPTTNGLPLRKDSAGNPIKFVESTDVEMQMKSLKDQTVQAEINKKGVSAALDLEKQKLETMAKENLLSEDFEKIHSRILEIENKKESLSRKGQSVVDKKLQWETEYNNKMNSLEKDSVDQQIRDHTLSLEDYKKYLDKELEYKLKSDEEFNQKVTNENKKNKTNLPQIDISKQKAYGQTENQASVNAYAWALENSKIQAALYSAQVQKEIENSVYQYKVKHYELSKEEYAKYLDDQLQIELKSLQEKNDKITEANKKNGTNNPTVDLAQFAVQKQAENKDAVKTYGLKLNDPSLVVINKITGEVRELNDEEKKAQTTIEKFGRSFSNVLVQGVANGENLGKVFEKLTEQIAETVAETAILALIMSTIAPGSGSFMQYFTKGLGISGGGGDVASLAGGGVNVPAPTTNQISGGNIDIGGKLDRINLNIASAITPNNNAPRANKIKLFGQLAGNDIYISSERAGKVYRNSR